MVTGLPPFYDENTNEMYKRILTEELRIPEYVGPIARDMLKKVCSNPLTRDFGAGH